MGSILQNKCTENRTWTDIPSHVTLDSIASLDLLKPISLKELKSTLKNLKNNKAPGPDEILNEYLKNLPNLAVKSLLHVLNNALKKGQIPDSWLQGYILPIYKKDEKSEPQNYRPITLLNNIWKLLSSMCNNRILTFLEEQQILSNFQAGFRKNRSCLDQVFI